MVDLDQNLLQPKILWEYGWLEPKWFTVTKVGSDIRSKARIFHKSMWCDMSMESLYPTYTIGLFLPAIFCYDKPFTAPKRFPAHCLDLLVDWNQNGWPGPKQAWIYFLKWEWLTGTEMVDQTKISLRSNLLPKWLTGTKISSNLRFLDGMVDWNQNGWLGPK